MTDEGSIPIPLDPLPEDPEDKRLWIGNLDPRVTEFALVKLLQKYGAIEKFDLLFHRSGPLEGQPRGYAFVSYTTSEIARTAKERLNGKLVGSKNICVKWAHNMTMGEADKQKLVTNIPALAGAKSEKKISKLTTIQAIEAKLKMMESSTGLPDFEINDKPTISTKPAYSKDQPSKHKFKNIDRHKTKPYSRMK